MNTFWKLTCLSALAAVCFATPAGAQRFEDGSAPSERDALRARSAQVGDNEAAQGVQASGTEFSGQDAAANTRQGQALNADPTSRTQSAVQGADAQATSANMNARDRNSRTANNRWRYKRHNGEWWYWTANNNWLFWRNGRWNRYNPDTFQNRVARRVEDGGARYVRNYDDRYYDRSYNSRRYYDGTYDSGRYYNDRFYDGGGRYWSGYRGDPRNYGGYDGFRYGYGAGYGNPYVNPRNYYGNRGYRSGADVGSAIGGALGGPAGAGIGGAIGGAIGADQ